jgi:hypothetical protein
VTPVGVIILTCQSQAVTKEGEKIGRGIWWVAQLGIPVATTRGYADRLVRHWLAFFKDETLARVGLKLFSDLFDSIPLHPSTSQTGRPEGYRIHGRQSQPSRASDEDLALMDPSIPF